MDSESETSTERNAEWSLERKYDELIILAGRFGFVENEVLTQLRTQIEAIKSTELIEQDFKLLYYRYTIVGQQIVEKSTNKDYMVQIGFQLSLSSLHLQVGLIDYYEESLDQLELYLSNLEYSIKKKRLPGLFKYLFKNRLKRLK